MWQGCIKFLTLPPSGEFVKSVEEEYQVVKSVRAEEYNIEKKGNARSSVNKSIAPELWRIARSQGTMMRR